MFIKLLCLAMICIWYFVPVYPAYAMHFSQDAYERKSAIQKGLYKSSGGPGGSRNGVSYYPQVKVSWYGESICRGRKLCKTASGKEFKPKQEYTTACWGEYPFFTVFRVTYNGNSVEVICTDRGAFKKMNRFLDLSSSAFEQLAPLSRGILKVDVEIIK